MRDNDLINLIATQIEASMASAGWNYVVIQKDAPDKQGIPTNPGVFLEKIGDHRYGHPVVKQTYRSVTDDFEETETQTMETTFQISALVIQNPNDITIPTASDVANYACMYMQSRTVIANLFQQGVSVLRVLDVRNPYFVDDRERFEGNPNFDLIVTHNKTITITVAAVEKVVGTPSSIPGDLTVGTFPVEDAPGEIIYP
jgi:hypothetical protein